MIDAAGRIHYSVGTTFDLSAAGLPAVFTGVNEGRVTALEVFSKICLEAVRECGPDSDARTIETVVRRRMEALPPSERAAITAAVESLVSNEPPAFQQHGGH